MLMPLSATTSADFGTSGASSSVTASEVAKVLQGVLGVGVDVVECLALLLLSAAPAAAQSEWSPFAEASVVQIVTSDADGAERDTSVWFVVVDDAGFVRTNPANPRNQTWRHPDGSEARIHAYGNVAATPYHSGNNAHIHNEDPAGNQLTDRGHVSTNADETHIGIKNPANYPAVSGRPHGS